MPTESPARVAPPRLRARARGLRLHARGRAPATAAPRDRHAVLGRPSPPMSNSALLAHPGGKRGEPPDGRQDTDDGAATSRRATRARHVVMSDDESEVGGTAGAPSASVVTGGDGASPQPVVQVRHQSLALKRHASQGHTTAVRLQAPASHDRHRSARVRGGSESNG